MADQRVGVEAVFDVDDFVKGLDAYIAGLDTAGKATEKFAEANQKQINAMTTGITAQLRQTGSSLTAFADQYNNFLTKLKIPTGGSTVDKAVATVNDDIQNTLKQTSADITKQAQATATAKAQAAAAQIQQSQQAAVQQANQNVAAAAQATANQANQIAQTAQAAVAAAQATTQTTNAATQAATFAARAVAQAQVAAQTAQAAAQQATQAAQQTATLANTPGATRNQVQGANQQAQQAQQAAQKAAQQAAVMVQVSTDIAAYIGRLEQIKADALRQIQDAANKSAVKAFDAQELKALRDNIRVTNNEIYRDMQQVINNLRGVARGSGLTTQLNREFIDLRTVVRNSVGDINSSLGNLRNGFSNVGQILSGLIRSQISRFIPTMALVAASIDLVRSALQKLSAASREGIDSVVFFERLGFALQTNIATELRKATDYTLDMGTALGQAKAQSQGLLREVEKIALKSQFTFRDVAETVKVSNAYGFTADQILRVTRALVDLGAARGLEPQQLQLVDRAIAQIIAKGKLYQQEINQLGENGINLVQILEEEGVATAEFIRQQQQKNEPITDAITAVEAILTNTERNFAGAGERLAFSLGGVLSTLDEIRQVTSREFFGGLLKGLEPLLIAFARFASTDEFRANLTLLGETIAKGVTIAINGLATALGYLQTAWSWVPPALQRGFIIANLLRIPLVLLIGTVGLLATAFLAFVQSPLFAMTTGIVFLATQWAMNFDAIVKITAKAMSTIGQLFADLINASVDWGLNIATSIADGMAAAVSYVIDALAIIGDAITYLLIPGSPPRLLPDLDKWGTEAAQVYLDAWTEADYSTLDKIANQFKSFFQALAQQGKVDEVSIPSMVIGVKQELAQAIAEVKQFGQISAETLTNIGSVGGEFGEILTGYITRYAKLAVVTDQVNASQERLNAITKQYDAILKPLQRRLTEVQNIRQTNEEAKQIRQLENIINSAYVSETRRAATKLELEELLLTQRIRNTQTEKDLTSGVVQDELDGAKDVQDELQKEYDLFDARIQQQLGINQLLGEQKTLMDRLAQEGLKKAKEEMDKQLKAIQLQRDEMNDLIRLAEIRYRLENDTLTQAEKQLLNLEEQQIALDRIQRAKEAGEIGVDLTYLQNVPIVPEDFLSKGELEDTTDAVGDLETKLKGLADVDLAKSFADYEKIVENQRIKWIQWGNVITETINKFKRAFGFTVEEPDTTFFDPKFVYRDFQSFFVENKFEPPPTFFESATTAFADGFFNRLDEKFTEKFAKLKEKFYEIVDIFTPIAEGIAAIFVGQFVLPKALTGLPRLLAVIGKLLAPVLAIFTKTGGGGVGIFARLGGVLTSLTGIVVRFGASLNPVTLAISLFVTAFTANWFGIRDTVIGAIQGIATFLDNTFDTGFFGDKLQGFLDFFTNIGAQFERFTSGEIGFGDFFTNVLAPIQGLVQGIKDQFNAVLDYLTINSVGEFLFKFLIDLPVRFLTLSAQVIAEALGLVTPVVGAGVRGLGESIGSEIAFIIGDIMSLSVQLIGLIVLAVQSIFDDSKKEELDGRVGEFFGSLWETISKVFGGNTEEMQKLWQEFTDNTLPELTKSVGLIVDKLSEVWTTAWEEDLKPAFKDAGKSIIEGLFDGILEFIKETSPTWIADIAEKIIGKWKEQFGIESPSTVMFEEVGTPIGQGIINGMVAAIDAGLTAIKTALTTIKDAVLGFFGFGENKTEGSEKQVLALTDQKDTSLLILTELRDGAAVLIEATRLATEESFKLLRTNLVGEAGTLTLTKVDAVQLFSAMSAGIVFQTFLQNTALVTLYNQLKTDITGEGGVITQLATSFKGRFQTMGDDVLSIMRLFIDALMTLLTGEEGLLFRIQTEFVDKGVDLGEQFALGLAEGILNKLEEVKQAATDVANATVEAAQASLETGSPSRRAARELGEPFSTGIIQGALSQLSALSAASGTIVNQLFGFADTVEQRMGLAPTGSSITNSSSRVNNFNLNVTSQQSMGNVVQDFGTMRAFAGA